MSTFGSNTPLYVTHDELETRLEDVHRRRWRAMAVWVALFSLLVTFALYHQRTLGNERVQDRKAQVAAIVIAGHQECLHAFRALTAVLHVVIPEKTIKKSKPAQLKIINELFSIADPKTNCPPTDLSPAQKKIIRQSTNPSKEN